MKNLWKRRSRKILLVACVILSILPLSSAKDESGFPEDIPVHTIDRGKSTPTAENSAQGQPSSPSLSSRAHSPHSRQRRQLFDGFRFSDIFRIFNQGALEGVDSVLRSTRNFDVFQCLERISCEMAAPLRDNGNSNHEPVEGLGEEVVDEGLQTFPTSFIQPGSQFIQVPVGTQFIQPVQVPIQQFPVQTGFQQVVQPAAQFAQAPAQFAHAPQQFAQPSVQHFVQQPFQGHAQAFRHGSQPTNFGFGRNPAESNIKRSDEAAHEQQQHQQQYQQQHQQQQHQQQHQQQEQQHQERESSPSFFDGYRNMIRRARERSPFFNRFLNPFNVRGRGRRRRRSLSTDGARTKVLHRTKRGVMDTIQRMWGGTQFIGVLDRMMQGTDDSLYPYTRAALMGYTGNTETCEKLYPDCPTSMDEVIDTFNNLRSYFPNGVPFRDRIPIPFRYLIP